jgi:CheY-like chemotaxis protein
LNKNQVLIVDDSEINQLIMKKMLEAIGIASINAKSGEEALKVLTENEINLIFMDIQMPGMDGYQTTKQIRAELDESNVPIIAVTANVTDEDKKLSKEAGMNAFLTKPIQPADINHIIDTYLKDMVIKKTEQSQTSKDSAQDFYQKMHGDLNFMKTMTERLDTSTREIFAAIEQAVSSRHFIEIPGLTHKMKGLLSAFEAQQALILNDNLTQAAKIQNAEEINTSLILLKSEIQKLLSDLREFINNKPANNKEE